MLLYPVTEVTREDTRAFEFIVFDKHFLKNNLFFDITKLELAHVTKWFFLWTTLTQAVFAVAQRVRGAYMMCSWKIGLLSLCHVMSDVINSEVSQAFIATELLINYCFTTMYYEQKICVNVQRFQILAPSPPFKKISWINESSLPLTLQSSSSFMHMVRVSRCHLHADDYASSMVACIFVYNLVNINWARIHTWK